METKKIMSALNKGYDDPDGPIVDIDIFQ